MHEFPTAHACVDRAHGYHRHLNPGELRLAALAAGYAPTPDDDDFRYLELGFGPGVSVGFHAAATAGTYWGTDANPDHAERARALAAASGAQAHLSDDAFWEFAMRRDLPDFDYIALHGVWSWITDESRDVIVDLIRRKLKPGGLAYVSYNTAPGWAPYVPVRQLMALFAARADTASAASGALRFGADVISAGADDGRSVPDLSRHLDALDAAGHGERIEAYLSGDWTLSTFSETAAHLAGARLTFAGSTQLLDSVEAFGFTPRSRQLLDRIDDPLLRETTKDVLTNARVRSDVYIKGGRPMSDEALSAQWSSQLFVLTTHASEIPAHVLLPPGVISLRDRVPGHVIAVLAEDDYAPKTIAQLCAHPRLARATADDVIAAMLLLAGIGHARAAQRPTAAIVDRCHTLNRHVRARARMGDPVEYLASPVTGGAIDVSRIVLLFLDAVEQGRDTVQSLARTMRSDLDADAASARPDVARAGPDVDGGDGVESMAERFLTATLPMLRALRAV